MSRIERMKRKRRQKRLHLALLSFFIMLTSVLVIGIINLEKIQQAQQTISSEQKDLSSEEEQNDSHNGDSIDVNDELESESGHEEPNVSDGENEQETDPIEEVKGQGSITLAFAGDTMAAGKVAPILADRGYMYPWEQAKPYFTEADLAMVNLETAVSTKGHEAEDKTFAFNSHPDLLKGASWAGIDLVTLANNHALDYGKNAFLDTLHYLHDHSLEYVGGGKNEAEAFARVDKVVEGKTIGFLGYSRVLPAVSWYAGVDTPGLASGYQEERVLEHIAKAAEETDLTIVYMHWGKELADEPEEKDRELARKMIEAGADIVIGSHPHVLQGLEYYKGKLIAYSLGNFIFTMSHNELGRQSAILQVNISEDGQQSARLIPMKIEHGAVWDADDETYKEIMQRMARLSHGGHWHDNQFLQN
ncbi:CapA family protein [Bacillus horti]|uniref:Poly-gamma-glutamate synthesis protein (Capsule biosynthesis protein) n=1 Tax=Caldalkalibacillus horti TaxID=77523 RepID=A0ABT9VXT0_9BACI|nr:CapA family protein [Bacillus horti]MDQ0165802.1 poly-gamma-glutamate synthesis protein (capsule biosynthesis protein) [Bacillus horti]